MVFFNRAIVAFHLVAVTSSFTAFTNVRKPSSQKRTLTRTMPARIGSSDSGQDNIIPLTKDIPLDIPLVVPNDDMEPINILDKNSDVDAIIDSTLLTEQPAGVDQGKEIFLASIADTSPEEITADMEAEPIVSGGSDGDYFVDDMMSNNSNSNNNGGALSDDERNSVISVLQASQEAAIAAEAAMPKELMEQLEFSSGPSNGTSLVSAPIAIDEIPEIKPASEIVGEPVTASRMESPSVSKILKFAIPAVGVWLCSPLLSLIDTSVRARL